VKPERNQKDNFRRGNRDGYRRSDPREETEENENQLEGRNALTEALRSGRTIDKVFIADGNTDRALDHLAAEAKKAGAVVIPVDRRKLDAMSTTRSHQGIIALAAAREYFSKEHLMSQYLMGNKNLNRLWPVHFEGYTEQCWIDTKITIVEDPYR